jgi:hypothetical protein
MIDCRRRPMAEIEGEQELIDLEQIRRTKWVYINEAALAYVSRR